jgi:hypothetical protein
MVWYASHWVASALFLPAGAVGALLPHTRLREAADAHPETCAMSSVCFCESGLC